jgi:hypothetical protein
MIASLAENQTIKRVKATNTRYWVVCSNMILLMKEMFLPLIAGHFS